MHKARAFFFVCAGLLCLALAYHLGARNAGAQSPIPEVTVRSGTCHENELLPLPTYSDGTTALESECQWIVSPGYIDASRFGACVQQCETLGRTVWYLEPNDPNNPSRANYLIIAIRVSGQATSTPGISIDQLKAKYATPAPAQPTR